MKTDIDQVKKEIAEAAGFSADLLTGETLEENIEQAKALLAYKSQVDAQKVISKVRSPEEQFEAWFNQVHGIEPESREAEALKAIAEKARIDTGGYPRVRDGEPDGQRRGRSRSTIEQFKEWFWDNGF